MIEVNELYEVIQSYNEYLRKLPEGCKVIATLLRENELVLAKENIMYFSEGLLWLNDAQQLLLLHDIKHNLEFDQIQHYLVQINNALEKEAFQEVATIFDSELYTHFNQLSVVPEA